MHKEKLPRRNMGRIRSREGHTLHGKIMTLPQPLHQKKKRRQISA